jgi:hypothetical protein
MEATVAAIEMEPAAVELIGSMIIKQAQSNLAYSRLTSFIEGSPEALLVIELIADTDLELQSKFDELETRMRKGGWGYKLLRMTNSADQQKVCIPNHFFAFVFPIRQIWIVALSLCQLSILLLGELRVTLL